MRYWEEVPASRNDLIAAVDLGSNSFHMVVARPDHGQLHVLDRLRARVALASGLDDSKRLTREASTRALACLEQFGQRLRHMPAGSVRAVGTNTLRQARNSREFLARAKRALGHPIEIISGREEARLIYLGVAHTVRSDAGRRLVVDIGGGSTEIVIGERYEVLQGDSLYMGCVSFSLRYFPGGKISDARLDRAITAAEVELEPIARRYRSLAWETCFGSSGTILAIGEILRASGWSDGTITGKSLRKLRRAVVEAGHVNHLDLPGLADDRKPVIAGGLAILSAVFAALDIDRMVESPGALREGLLYDLRGRIRREDVREQSVRGFAERYRVDAEHASRVERTAMVCFDQVARPWKLDPGQRRMLAWAARLHEVGLSIAFSGYHKHGAYLVANADLPGFSREDQALLAFLLRSHRRRLHPELFAELPEAARDDAFRLCVLLRLAVCLCRSRSPGSLSPPRLIARGRRSLALVFPRGYLAGSALTRADLAEEAELLEAARFRLTFR